MQGRKGLCRRCRVERDAAVRQATSCARAQTGRRGRMQGQLWQRGRSWHRGTELAVFFKDTAKCCDLCHPKEARTACQTDNIDNKRKKKGNHDAFVLWKSFLSCLQKP